MEAAGAIGGAVISGVLNNRAIKKTNAQNLQLAKVQRGDTLRQQRFDNQLALRDRSFRDGEAAYQKRLDRRNAIRERLANDMAFRQNFIQMLNGSVRR
jgi:hypothetical protein